MENTRKFKALDSRKVYASMEAIEYRRPLHRKEKKKQDKNDNMIKTYIHKDMKNIISKTVIISLL